MSASSQNFLFLSCRKNGAEVNIEFGLVDNFIVCYAQI